VIAAGRIVWRATDHVRIVRIVRTPAVRVCSLRRVRIDVERSGGFAGIRCSRSVDTNRLTAPEAAQWQRLVDAADLAALEGPARNPGPDRFRYVISIADGDRRRRVTLDEEDLNDDRRELVDHVMRAPADSS